MPSIITEQTSGGADRVRVQVPAGETSPPIYVTPEAVVVASPGAGGSMSAEATWSLKVDVEQGVGRWVAWDAGTITARAAQNLFKATAVRFTATGQAGVGEVVR